MGYGFYNICERKIAIAADFTIRMIIVEVSQ